MLHFRDLVLEDKEWIDPILRSCNYLSCEYCFGNHFIWKNVYREKVARIGGYYTLLLRDDEGERGNSFLFPAGQGPLEPVIEELLEFCREEGMEFRLHSMPEECIPLLEEAFPGRFRISENRDYADYIYRVSDLTDLPGKKYHGKRNHLARFRERNWSFEPITDENFPECLAMNEEWCRIRDCGRSEAIKSECCAVRRSFAYFRELGFFGGLLRVDGRVVAYTLGERLNSNTVVVHMEKALPDIQGAYVAINREFVANCCQEYEFVNREEDLGVEGLRKAKLSWNPAFLLPKYSVTLR